MDAIRAASKSDNLLFLAVGIGFGKEGELYEFRQSFIIIIHADQDSCRIRVINAPLGNLLYLSHK